MIRCFAFVALPLLAQEAHGRYGNPSFPLCEQGVGAEVFGEVIYAQPLIESFSYAIRNDVRQQSPGGVSGTPGGPILDLNPDWQPGFRIAASYAPGLTARFVWMHFLGKSDAASKMNSTLPGLGLEGTWVPAIDSLILYSKVSLRWRIDFDTIDLELGKYYQVSASLKMNPAISARFTRINQSFHAAYQANQADAQNDFLAVGPRMVLDSQWDFTRDWKIFARVAASMLYGNFEIENSFSTEAALPSPMLQKVSEEFYRFEPNAELSLGIGWERCLSNGHCLLGVRLSYEAQLFWNQLELRQLSGSDAPALALLQTKDLSIQGFALRGSLAF